MLAQGRAAQVQRANGRPCRRRSGSGRAGAARAAGEADHAREPDSAADVLGRAAEPQRQHERRGGRWVRIVVDRQGRVAEVRSAGRAAAGFAAPRGTDGASRPVIAPPSESFVKAAMDAVRQWQYEPPADGPIAFDVAFAFMPGAEPRLLSHGGLSRGIRCGSGWCVAAPAAGVAAGAATAAATARASSAGSRGRSCRRKHPAAAESEARESGLSADCAVGARPGRRDRRGDHRSGRTGRAIRGSSARFRCSIRRRSMPSISGSSRRPCSTARRCR